MSDPIVWSSMRAEDIGKRSSVVGPKLTDEKLLREIRRLKRSVASFGGAMLLAAYRADAERRGLQEV
jgi:hypothetical protein